jgi:short subunit dehydrogenase-like uncharacterized protein
MTAKLDLVVYGATGFTGRLVARYLARHAPPSLTWGIGGRDAGKLATLRAELVGLNTTLQSLPLVVGSGDSASVVAKAARAVISTAGPFLLHGEPLIAAWCVVYSLLARPQPPP